MLAVVQCNLSVLLSAMEKSCTTRTALALARWPSSELFAYVRVRVPRVAIRGRGLVEEIRYHHHYGVCKTFVVAAAATVYQEPHFLRDDGQKLFAFLLDQKIFRVWIHCSTWSNLTQEIQFLEFMGGSNSVHAHSNYLICMRFIQINTVFLTHDHNSSRSSPSVTNNWMYILCLTN